MLGPTLGFLDPFGHAVQLLFRISCADSSVIVDSNGPCSKRSCNHYSICVESGDLAFCECPECTEAYNPVCGGDGVTYDSLCKLQREACLKETDITIVENEPCSTYNLQRSKKGPKPSGRTAFFTSLVWSKPPQWYF